MSRTARTAVLRAVFATGDESGLNWYRSAGSRETARERTTMTRRAVSSMQCEEIAVSGGSVAV